MSQNCWDTICIMPFGPVTNFLLAEFIFVSSLWLLTLISGTEAICKTVRSGYVIINNMLNRQDLGMS